MASGGFEKGIIAAKPQKSAQATDGFGELDLLRLQTLSLSGAESERKETPSNQPSKTPPMRRSARLAKRAIAGTNAQSSTALKVDPKNNFPSTPGLHLRATTGRRARTPDARPSRDSKLPATVTPVSAPVPSEAYLLRSHVQPRALAQPQKLLLILDLNGTLVHRPDRKRSTHIVARPLLPAFFDYILQQHCVMVWSSAREQNVHAMCNQIFDSSQRDRLLAIWGRNTLDLTKAQYNSKVQVYKRLEKVWSDEKIAAAHPEHGSGRRWDQTNTVLIDDSSLKAAAQPHNLLLIPEFVGLKEQMENNTLERVIRYLDFLKRQDNVSAFIRQQPFELNADLGSSGAFVANQTEKAGTREH